jgi:glycosyltransferase involved in cell wall biosynthesis
LSVTVSIIIPTLNSMRTLRACLDAIAGQDYPLEKLEVVLADAGSTDGTRELAGEYAFARVVENPLKTGEAGKAAAIEAAEGEFLALIDSDNVLESPDWLRKMLAPFADPRIAATEPLE